MPECGGRVLDKPMLVNQIYNNNNNINYQVLRTNSPYLQGSRGVLVGGGGTPQRTVSQVRAPAGFNSVIVNPLPPTHNMDTVPFNHTQTYPGHSLREELEKKPNTEEAEEPIYQEIKPKPEEKTEVEEAAVQQQQQPGRKKEIEYWQITAKEVVKFRPCTETFIKRS